MVETNKENTVNILETFFNKGEKTEPKFKSLEELAISVANKFKNNRKSGGDDSSEIEYVTHDCIIFDNYQQYKEFKKNDKTGCNGWSKEFKEFIDEYNEHVLEQGYLPEGVNSVNDLIQYCKEAYPEAIERGDIPENVSLELYTDMVLNECDIIQPDKWNTNCWNCIGKVSIYNGREGFFVTTSDSNNCEIINDPYMLTFDEYFNQIIQMMLQEYHMTYDELVEMVIQQMGSWDVFVEMMKEYYEDEKYSSNNIGRYILRNCNNCVNCFECQYCVNCKKCNNCGGDSENIFSNCENCTDCYYCENCINVNGSSYCKNCINCGKKDGGDSCYKCNDCNGCLRCNDCNKCINCLECDYCESCGVCNHCNNCLECVKCEGCNKCYDCKETTDIENSQCMYKNWYKSEVFNQ